MRHTIVTRPVFYQPSDWLSFSWPELKRNIPTSDVCIKLQRDSRWSQITGVDAESSKLAVIFPIHNEEDFLRSSLNSYFFNILPSGSGLIHVFIVNGSTDRSFQCTQSMLEEIGTEIEMPNEILKLFNDLNRAACYELNNGNIAFLFDIQEASKANAQNLGNKIALFHQCDVCISLDTNIWISPESIATMYKDSIQSFTTRSASALAGDSKINTRYKNPVSANREKHGRSFKRDKQDDKLIAGWFISWNPRWLEHHGGVPRTCIEDFSLAVLAQVKGDGVKHSTAWGTGYVSCTIAEVMEANMRAYKGTHQTRAYFRDTPEALRLIDEISTIKLSFKQRLHSLIFNLQERKFHVSLLLICKFLLDEFCVLKAKRELAAGKNLQSWKAIPSTKHISRKK